MPRVVDFAMDGVQVKLASMTWAQAEKFSEAGRALLARGDDVKVEEWLHRTLTTVSLSMIVAGSNAAEVIPSKLKETFDMPTINAMYMRILELSGLKAATQGEAPAA